MPRRRMALLFLKETLDKSKMSHCCYISQLNHSCDIEIGVYSLYYENWSKAKTWNSVLVSFAV